LASTADMLEAPVGLPTGRPEREQMVAWTIGMR